MSYCGAALLAAPMDNLAGVMLDRLQSEVHNNVTISVVLIILTIPAYTKASSIYVILILLLEVVFLHRIVVSLNHIYISVILHTEFSIVPLHPMPN